MLFVKHPIAQLFEIGYSLGLVHDELASGRSSRPRVKVGDEIERCLSAAGTIRERATTQRQVAAAEALRVKLESLAPGVRRASSPRSRDASAEDARGFLAEVRSPAAVLSPQYGRPWLALGSAVARWEMSSPSKAEIGFLGECWKHARSQVDEKLKWLDRQLKAAAKKRKRIGSLAESFRNLFWDHWEYNRNGKDYVGGNKVTIAEYKVLAVLRIFDGQGFETKDLGLQARVHGVHNTLSRLRHRKAFHAMISRTAPARWIDLHFPMPEPGAIPRDLHEFTQARIR